METIKAAAQAVQQSATKLAPNNAPPSSAISPLQDAFAAFNPKVHERARYALQAVKSWTRDAINGQGRAIILYASVKRPKGNGYGNGKTMLAKCAYNALNATLKTPLGIPDRSGIFTTSEKFLSDVKGSYEDNTTTKYFNQLKSARFLILDDFGTEYAKELSWLQEQFFKILNYAYDARQPFLMTSNLIPDDIIERLGGKNWSRLDGLMGGPHGSIDMSEIPDQRKGK